MLLTPFHMTTRVIYSGGKFTAKIVVKSVKFAACIIGVSENYGGM